MNQERKKVALIHLFCFHMEGQLCNHIFQQPRNATHSQGILKDVRLELSFQMC